MTQYTPHSDSIYQPLKPIIGATQLQQRDNLLAVAESDATAPKRKQKVTVGSLSGAGSVVLAGLTSYQGFLADIIATNGSGSPEIVQMELSDNGTTFYGLATLFTLPAGTSTTAKMSMDTTTGSYSVIYSQAAASGTIAGSSSAVTHLRFTTGSVTSIAVMLFPNGGHAS